MLFKNPANLKLHGLLVSRFKNNPRIKLLLGKSHGSCSIKLKLLITYVICRIENFGYILSDSSKNSSLLYFRKSEFKFSLQDTLRYIYLLVKVIGISRVPNLLYQERLIKQIRNRNAGANLCADYLYVWFLAQEKNYSKIDGLLSLRRLIFDKADFLNLPIYIETSEQRLVPLYQRMGFTFYHEQNFSTGLKLYFAKYEPYLTKLSNSLAA